MKKIMQYMMAIGMVFFMNGCFEEKITCDNPVTQALVKKLAKKEVGNLLFVEEYKKGVFEKPDQFTTIFLTQARGNFDLLDQTLLGQINRIAKAKKKDSAPTFYDKLRKQHDDFVKTVQSTPAELKSFITYSTNEQGTVAECEANMHLVFNNKEYPVNVVYTTRFTDNREEIEVVLHSAEIY